MSWFLPCSWCSIKLLGSRLSKPFLSFRKPTVAEWEATMQLIITWQTNSRKSNTWKELFIVGAPWSLSVSSIKLRLPRKRYWFHQCVVSSLTKAYRCTNFLCYDLNPFIFTMDNWLIVLCRFWLKMSVVSKVYNSISLLIV